MKRGFTLIELLAVIVILAIIALIAVPIVLNIINDSKESSLLMSAEFYLDAVEYTIADAFLYHGGLEDKEYPITTDGDMCKIELDNEGNCPLTGDKSNILKVEVNGDKPTGGYIKIKEGKVFEVMIEISNKELTKSEKDNSFILLGDVNEDGVVNKFDAIELSKALMHSKTVNSLRNGDINNDGVITVIDINLLSTKVGKVIVTDPNGDGIIGDADGNGLIDENDTTLLMKCVDGFDGFAVQKSLDVNGDGKIKIFDTVFLLQILEGKEIIY